MVRPPCGWPGNSPRAASRSRSTPSRATVSSLRSRPSSGPFRPGPAPAAVDGGSGPGRRKPNREANSCGVQRAVSDSSGSGLTTRTRPPYSVMPDFRPSPAIPDGPAPLRPGPWRRRASGGPSAGTAGCAASRSSDRSQAEANQRTLPRPLARSSSAGSPPRNRARTRVSGPGSIRVIVSNDRAAEVAVLGVGEGLEHAGAAAPSDRAARAVRVGLRGTEDLPHAQPGRVEVAGRPGREAVAGEDERGRRRARRTWPRRCASDAPRSSTFASTTASVFSRSGKRLAPGERRPSWGRTGTWRSARPAGASRRRGLEEVGRRLVGDPAGVAVHQQHPRRRRDGDRQESPVVERQLVARRASTCPRQSPSASSPSGNSTVAVAPPSRSTVRSRSRFWPPASTWRRTGHFATGQRRGVEHGRGDRRGIAGPRGRGRDRDARHGDVPGERAAQVAEPDLDVRREDHGLAPVEPRTLEVGQDVQLAGLLPRTDEQVARPGHRRGVVGARVGRLERVPCGGRSAAPSAGPTVSNSADLQLGPRAGPVQDRPGLDSAGRSAGLDPRRPMLAERSSSTTTRRSPAVGSVATRYGRANSNAIRAMHAIRTARSSRRRSFLRRASCAEHDLEELERPQVDRRAPGGGTSGG